MTLSNQQNSRTIIAHTLYPNASSEGQFGFVKPVAELIGDKLVEVTPESFCHTMKVFITNQYDDLERRYPNRELFKLTVTPNDRPSQTVDPAFTSKYVAIAKRAEPLKPRDVFEIIDAPLPAPNQRNIDHLQNPPGTRYIFINDGTFVYGPMKWSARADTSTSINIGFIDAPLPGIKLAPSQIYRVPTKAARKRFIPVQDSATSRHLVNTMDLLADGEPYDYATDEEIVKFCAKLASENSKPIDRATLEILLAGLSKLPASSVPMAKERLERLPRIMANSVELQDSIYRNMSDYLKGEAGMSIVARYVEHNERHFVSHIAQKYEGEINDRVASLKRTLDDTTKQVERLEQNRQALLREVDHLMSDGIAEAQEKLKQEQARVDEALAEKRQSLATLDADIMARHNLSGDLVTADAIASRVEELRAQEANLRDEVEKLRLLQSEMEKELTNSESALRAKLATLRPYFAAMGGSAPATAAAPAPAPVHHATANDMLPHVTIATHAVLQAPTVLERQRFVVSEIRRRLGKRGRPMSDAQIANLLVCTQQSMLTFFAGLPGIGKTTLARLLAVVQNVAPRLKEVPVARGWMSQKELIGFHNPLADRFQPSATGLYPYLKALDAEHDTGSQAMSYILLDEANLSPIEHYWSAFMGMTDTHGNRTLQIGQETIRIPEHLRFIGTINYDGTTEPLSPRILNRAPIIMIESQGLDDETTENVQESEHQPLPLAYEEMNALFGNERRNGPDLSRQEKPVYEQLRAVLSEINPALGRPLAISPRKEIAVRNYCDKARALMLDHGDLAALDLAILQHILPSVRGNGTAFAQRLEKLRDTLSATGLRKSPAFIEQMIENGNQEMHSYDFFCW